MKLKDFNQDGVPDAVLPIYDSAPIRDGAKFLSAFGVWLGRTGQGGSWQGELEADPYCIVQLNAPNPNLISTGNVSISGDANGLVAANVNAAIADFNQDGLFDLALPEVNGVTFLLNPGNGRFDQAAKVFVATATGQQGVNLVVGDLNNDGFPDLATSNNIVNNSMMLETGTWTAVAGPVTVFLNSSSTGGGIQMTASPVIISPLDYNGSLQLADLNLDGNLDMVVGSAAFQNHNFAVAQGDGTGSFGTFKLFQGFTDQADIYSTYKRSLPALAIGDMNGDGLPDIVSEGQFIPRENYGSEGDGTSGVGITGVSYNTTFSIPAATPWNLPNATTGIAYSQTLGHTGGDPSKTYTFSLNPASVALPAGLTLSASGLISGTPATPGNYQLYVDVIQPNGLRGSSFVNLVVTNAQPGVLTINPATLPGATAGTAYSQQLSTTGGSGTIAYAINSGALPPGLTLSPTGLISGTPTTTGVASFTISATDSAGNVGYRPYSLTVGTSPTPPLAGPFIAAGSGQGGLVSVFNADGTPRLTLAPYGAGYKGAVTVAQGDVNGDGVA
ncbi:MAG: putative Ig domain-containing protein, partial [Gemmataceae bacterium]